MRNGKDNLQKLVVGAQRRGNIKITLKMKSYTPANHDILANLCINIFSFALLTFCTVQDFFWLL